MTIERKDQVSFTFVRARIPREKKRQLAALAQERGVSEAKLLRLAVYQLLKEPDPKKAPATHVVQQPLPQRRDRLIIPIDPALKRKLQERGAPRNLTAGGYVSRLIQAHLEISPRLPATELAAVERAVLALNAIGRDLNHLVRGANEGAGWADAVSSALERTLSAFAMLTTHLSDFTRITRKSWDSGWPDEKP
jgi:hypothetical protein